MIPPPSDQPRIARNYQLTAQRRWLRADLLTVVSWIVVAFSLGLWFLSGGSAAMVDLPHTLVQLGVASGLMATATCVLMLFLIARIPIVDKAVGHDRALAAHRSLGTGTLLGLLAHAVFLVAGGSMIRHKSFFAGLVGMLHVPDFLLAVLGLIAFALVGVVSIKGIKRALGHEAWHVMHCLAYAAVLLSLPHQFSVGLFEKNGPMRWYWMILFAAAFLCVLLFRVLVPVLRTYRLGLRVTDVYPAGPDAVNIEMCGRGVETLGAAAGQFFHFRFLAPGLWWHQHPFSITRPASTGMLRITVRNLGKGSAALQQVEPGTRVHVSGPYGIFSDEARTTAEGLVLIGAGIGIAPVRSILEETHVRPGAATVILRASDENELYLLDEISALCEERGAELYVALGHRAAEGWLPGVLDWRGVSLIDIAPQAPESDVYICGPQEWSRKVREDALECEVPANRIHDERFSW